MYWKWDSIRFHLDRKGRSTGRGFQQSMVCMREHCSLLCFFLNDRTHTSYAEMVLLDSEKDLGLQNSSLLSCTIFYIDEVSTFFVFGSSSLCIRLNRLVGTGSGKVNEELLLFFAVTVSLLNHLFEEVLEKDKEMKMEEKQKEAETKKHIQYVELEKGED